MYNNNYFIFILRKIIIVLILSIIFTGCGRRNIFDHSLFITDDKYLTKKYSKKKFFLDPLIKNNK